MNSDQIIKETFSWIHFELSAKLMARQIEISRDKILTKKLIDQEKKYLRFVFDITSEILTDKEFMKLVQKSLREE